jgi:hypothetical protein
MKQLFLISHCQKKVKGGYQFHFRGVYRGNYISKILVQSENHLHVDGVYLLGLAEIELRDHLLITELIQSKLIS